VGGDLFTPRDKDFDGRPLTDRQNNPRVEYVVQLALPKSDPATEEFRALVYKEAVESFPTLFPGGQPSPQAATFSYKWTDGDSTTPNARGKIPSQREGYPGHWILTFRSSFAPDVVGQAKEPITDPRGLKRGDYIRIAGTCKGNGSQSKPGVYLNQSLVQLCGYGEAISSGPDVDTAFAEAPKLPAGASATPVAPGPMPGAPTPGAPAPAPGGVPAGAAAPVPASAPAPAPAGVPGPAPLPAPGFGATPPAPAPPAPAAAGPQTKPGCPYTYESLKAQGWTDDQMRQQGYL
jgi:hypothetical protein